MSAAIAFAPSASASALAIVRGKVFYRQKKVLEFYKQSAWFSGDRCKTCKHLLNALYIAAQVMSSL